MFKPVEAGQPALNEETVFLLAFRALAYELYMKQSALSCLPIQRENDKGKPFEAQCFVQQYLHAYEYGLKRGLADVTRWKSEYDTAFINKKFDRFRFYSVAFSEILPVMACGAFHPEFDFDGKSLQLLGRGEAPFEHMTYNLTALDGVSVLVFGWTEESGGPAAQFVGSYQNVPSAQKADAAIRLAFEQVENIYMKPSWWNGLDRAIQEDAIQRTRSGTGLGGIERQPECTVMEASNI
jgi:hypothetical protein